MRSSSAASVLQDGTFTQGGAAFAPDGRWLAYVSLETGSQEVYVRPFPGPGGKVRVSTSGGAHAMWSRQRSELFYRSPDNTMMAAPYAIAGDTFRVGKPARWSATAVEQRGPFRNIDLHPDGQRFAVTTAAAEEARRDHVTLILDFANELRRIAPALR